MTIYDILDKMQFFQGQRAGRELWNDKPIEVQQQDLDSFNKGIRDIRDYMWDLEKELEEYKKLEEQGLLLKLPCKVGDVVYQITGNIVSEFRIKTFVCDNKTFFFHWECIKGIYKNVVGFHSSRIGVDVFLTKEEAEKKLSEMVVE